MSSVILYIKLSLHLAGIKRKITGCHPYPFIAPPKEADRHSIFFQGGDSPSSVAYFVAPALQGISSQIV